MQPADFDFELPDDRIAQKPASRRVDARMMVLRGENAPLDSTVAELPDLLGDDPLVVLNDSRVVPARLHATRDDGRRFELLVCDPGADRVEPCVRAWVRGARRLKPGQELAAAGLRLRYVGVDERDPRARRFEIVEGELLTTLHEAGQVPLPPYIVRERGPSEVDADRYQTTFAVAPGSVAAPTAGLHFDSRLLGHLDHATVTLHVGPGTFLPMECDDVRDHEVGAERFSIGDASAAKIETARAQGRPILAVGTTVTRTLESVARAHGGRVVAGDGRTDLVITVGHRFAVIDRLLTNFHLPRSSLLMLACAFGGRGRVLAAYADAVARGYRFYSYGDCMLLDADPETT